MQALKRKNILHITPHLGGGVGKVLLNYLKNIKANSSFSHKILSLEYANEEALLSARNANISIVDRMSLHPAAVLAAVAAADIVLVHWWNHPLLYAFLVRESLPACRLVFWSHISGFHPPYVFARQALAYPDLFVFTTPISFQTPEVRCLDKLTRRRLRVIWSTGGIGEALGVRPKPHAGFNIGYIGTVDYAKMHPHFLKMCSKVNIPAARFIICGSSNEKVIQRESRHYDSGGRFVFTGYVKDVSSYLAEFDVFGYPLAPYHYGTCEQALCESMAAGVPPVVLANRAESCIVENRVTGIIARDEKAYPRAIEMLYRNPGLRKELSRNAKKTAKQRFSIERMVGAWESVFREVLDIPKTSKSWLGVFRGKRTTAAQVFCESLGDRASSFRKNLEAVGGKEKKQSLDAIRKIYETSGLWRAKTRGTPSHYHHFFPEDRLLKLWSRTAISREANRGYPHA